jgi:hypothetical protein
LNVLFLAFEIFWFLVFHKIFKFMRNITWFEISTFCRIIAKRVNIWTILFLFRCSLIWLGVLVLHLNEAVSSLKSSSLYVFCSLRKKITEIQKIFLANAHEYEILFFFLACGWEIKIRLEVIQNLIISKIRIFGQVQDWLLSDFIIIIISYLYCALSNEVHFLNIALTAYNSLIWHINSAIELND